MSRVARASHGFPPARPDAARLSRLARSFRGRRVLVVGDLIADEYLHGSTERISREAPVLILRFRGRALVPGGAGNAAANLASLGAKVTLVGVVSRTGAGAELRDALRARDIDTTHLVEARGYETSVKTRILSGGLHTTAQQVIRIDRGGEEPPSAAVLARVARSIARLPDDFDAALVSDYDLGLFGNDVVEAIRDRVLAPGNRTVIDTHRRLFDFPGAALATPNESEAFLAAGSNARSGEFADVARIARALLARSGDRGLLITRGAAGVAWFDESLSVSIPVTRRDEIADVTGAGDSVAAAAALALAAGANPLELAMIANIAGGIKVMKRGTYAVPRAELEAEIVRLDGGPIPCACEWSRTGAPGARRVKSEVDS